MTKRIMMASGELRLSKAGVDVETADPETGLLLGAGIYPTQILISGIIHIAAPDTTGTVMLPYALPYVPLAIFSSVTTAYFQDPYGGWTSNTVLASTMEVLADRLNFTIPTGDERYICYVVFRVPRA